MAPRSAVLTAVLAAVAVLGAAPAAQAGCGEVVTAEPGKMLGGFDNPLIIGDSVLLGAVAPVARIGFEVDAHGCRSWSEGARIVRRRKSHGHLPHLVAMFLGADWDVSVAQIRETLFRLGPKRMLVLVTPRELGGKGGPDAEHMRDVAAENPHRVLLLDWVRHTRGKRSWFAPDGIHLGYPGITGLRRFLKPALRYAAPGAFPGPPPEDEPAPAPEPPPAG
jgi:hypothetical protein